jgi:hypothetical protein
MDSTQVKPGQVWKEADPRFHRPVEVMAVDTVTGKVTLKNPATGRSTKASLARFNGKRSGYTLLKDVP